MDRSENSFQGLDAEEDNEDLLTLSLSTGPRSSTTAPPASSPLVSTAAPALSPLVSIAAPVLPASSPLGLQIVQPTLLPLTPTARLLPQTSFIQQFHPIPQAPPLPSSYPNHQTHSPTSLNPSDNGVPQEIVSHSRPSRSRRNPFQNPREGKTETIEPPFPWATTQRATVHSLDYLLSHNMTTISGQVQCKKCEKFDNIEYNLEQKFRETASFISENKLAMHDRAPSAWMNPNLPSCKFCGGCVKPVLAKKRAINWLFLLLGGMLGCCKLSELKYFCKHTKNHRTGAKDRVLYLTYLGLCKQLDPNGPFDV
ncbi:hypothetical protein DITRI_Ditri12bG0161800 [Diplodiscus trichospermus]